MSNSLIEQPKASPKVAQLFNGLDTDEIKVVNAIANKRINDTWERIADSLNISRRTLFNYRQDAKIQHAIFEITIGTIKTEFLDVARQMLAQAKKKSNVQAARLVFDYLCEIWKMESEYGSELEKIKIIVMDAFNRVSPEQSEIIEKEFKNIGRK